MFPDNINPARGIGYHCGSGTKFVFEILAGIFNILLQISGHGTLLGLKSEELALPGAYKYSRFSEMKFCLP
jgi:hypothetical protein